MFDFDTAKCCFMSEEGDFISKDFGVARLNEHRGEVAKVTEEWGGVGVGKVFSDSVGTKVARDGIEVVCK